MSERAIGGKERCPQALAGLGKPPPAAGSQSRNVCCFTPETQFHSLEDFSPEPFSPLLLSGQEATPACPGPLNHSGILDVVRVSRGMKGTEWILVLGFRTEKAAWPGRTVRLGGRVAD